MNCHICNKVAEEFVDEKTDIHYYHCSECEYIFKSPDYYQSFESQKERYNLHTNDTEDEGYKAYFQRFLDFTLPLVGTSKEALDFGCGESTILSDMLKEAGMDCDYYDPIYHPETLKRDKKYDLIVSTEVFEHLHHPREVFSDLISRLKVRGYLAIQTQFHSNEHKSFKQWYYHHDQTHIVFFRPKTFSVLAELYGYTLIAHNSKNMVILQKQ